MTVAALTIYLAWMGAAFGWRSLRQWRHTGRAGFRSRSAVRRGSIQWWVQMLFGPALLCGAAGPVTALAGLPSIAVLDRLVVAAVGCAFAVVGATTTVVAQLSMGESWRIGVDESERTELVTTGAFRVVRNPVFAAVVLTGTGITLMVPNAVAVAGLVALVTAIELQVRAVEEPYLARVHGSDYARYVAAVGRFFPRIGRISVPEWPVS